MARMTTTAPKDSEERMSISFLSKHVYILYSSIATTSNCLVTVIRLGSTTEYAVSRAQRGNQPYDLPATSHATTVLLNPYGDDAFTNPSPYLGDAFV